MEEETNKIIIKVSSVLEALTVLKVLATIHDAKSGYIKFWDSIELDNKKKQLVLNGIHSIVMKVKKDELNQLISTLEDYLPEVEYNVKGVM